jgi:hypothetical protein
LASFFQKRSAFPAGATGRGSWVRRPPAARRSAADIEGAITEGGIAAGLKSPIKQGHRAARVSASERFLLEHLTKVRLILH